MKLGTQTASLVNHLYSLTNSPEPVVGMGVTFLYWTDRSPGTIVEINRSRYIVCTDDDYRRIDANGMSESQEYEYNSNFDGRRRYFRKDKKNKWREMVRNENGRLVFAGSSSGLLIGEREKYHDFTF